MSGKDTLTSLGAVYFDGPGGRMVAFGDADEHVSHPPHYRAPGGLESIDVIEAFPHLRNSFALGNAVKYLLRGPNKGALLQDLKKARQYITRVINELEGNGKGWEP